MSINKILTGSFFVLVTSAAIATPTPDAMRAQSAVKLNSKLASSISLTKDGDNNIICYHVNGVDPADAEILLSREPSPLSEEYTIISGVTREGSTCWFMLPSTVATARVVEGVSKQLVNEGATSIRISKQTTGKPQ